MQSGAAQAAEAGSGSGERIDDWFYELRWQAKAVPGAQGGDELTPEAGNGSAPVGVAGDWLILADGGGVAAALLSRLPDGARALVATPGSEFRRLSETTFELDPSSPEQFRLLLREAGGEGGGGRRLRVLHLWGLDVRGSEYDSAEELMQGQRHGCGSLLHLAQSLSAGEVQARLWVVTRGAHAVGPEGQEAEAASEQVGVEAAQTPVWGLGRVIAHEQPGQWGGLIDLDPRAEADECAAQLAGELLAAAAADEAGEMAEGEVGYRAGQRYVPRLVRADGARAEAAGGAEAAATVSGEATYLITGGMGGLGLKVASSLVGKGATHLLLAGRREPSEEARRAIQQVEEAGAEVHCQLADVGEAEQVRELLATPERLGWPAVRGVVHAAGVLDDGVLSGQNWERFERVMRSKVRGAWNLAEATQGKGLDFLILFSSAASVLGSPGQANYAAANAYLDGLAQAGCARGERWLSINWGAWAEV